MGQALYRKYRSRSLAEVAGQEHVTQTLAKAVKQGKISHAYLFTGPRGVGKTSVARILAHLVNDLEYKDDSPHIDIIEIDAASNRRIDEIRDLREKVYIAPAQAKYKVYIIDEVHMLTREAFNALLKTLEEPPAHAIFILATTDAHKLPDTIISRTQRFSFKPASPDEVIKHLKKIAAAEKLATTDEALELIAAHGSGSFRDSLSLLDQLASSGRKVDMKAVELLLGLPSAGAVDELLEQVKQPDPAALMRNLAALFDQAVQPGIISQQLGRRIRDSLADGRPVIERPAALELLMELINVPAAFYPERALEIALLRAQPTDAASTPEKSRATTNVASAAPPDTDEPASVDSTPVQSTTNKNRLLNEALWPEVLKALKQKHNTLYGVVRMGEPDFSDRGKLKLSFAFNFHQKRLSETGNRQKLIDIIDALTGQKIMVECIVDKTAEPPKPTVEAAGAQSELAAPSNQDLSNISNIFGNAELLES